MPVRVTYHPMPDRLVDWHPDGKRAAVRLEPGERPPALQPALPGRRGRRACPTKLPLPYGEFGAISPDGRLLAYTPKSRDFRNWKRYRGGWAPDIWVFDLTDSSAVNITDNPANDGQPMWHGDTLYFLSDRGPEQRYNIWAWNRGTKAMRQVTHFRDFDITFPAIGPSDIVFQAGGRLYRLELPTERQVEVPVQVVTDAITLRPRQEPVAGLIQSAWISPTGKRALFAARGDLFTVPAEHGPVLDLTRSSGVAERNPSWSPDGKSVAYFSDRSGEYELTVRPADGSGAERTLTSLGAGFRYTPYWSPDGKKLAFVDQRARIHLYDLDRNRTSVIDSSRVWASDGALNGFRMAWSPDSRWLSYARPVIATSNSAVFLYDAANGRLSQATSGYFSDADPVFDPDGKYLYFFSNRTFDAVYGAFDNSWTYPNPTRIIAVPLRPDVPSPLAARDDAEPDAADTSAAAKATAKTRRRSQVGRRRHRDQARGDRPRRASRAGP